MDIGNISGLADPNSDVSRKAFMIRTELKRLQESFNVIEKVSTIYYTCTNGHKTGFTMK
jgi:hypothetical protein